MKTIKTAWLIGLSLVFGDPGATELFERKIQHQGLERSYTLYEPALGQDEKHKALLILLHGGGKADGFETAKKTGFLELVKKKGVLAAFPDGVDAQWNDGRGKTYRQSDNTTVDDVGFLSRLIKELSMKYGVSSANTFVVGISNGGMMTQRLACEKSHQLTAVASIISSMPKKIAERCKPEKALSVLIMNGTHDPIVPFKGGEVRFFRKRMGEVISTRETVHFWRDHNQCKKWPQSRKLPDIDKKDGSSVELKRFDECMSDKQVVWYHIMGGGHILPTSKGKEFKRLTGQKNRDIEGAERIWQFFQSHLK